MAEKSVFRSVHLIFSWGRLGQLGHGVFIGFQPPQLFGSELGQLGQICPIKSRCVQVRENAALVLSLLPRFRRG